MTPVINPWAIYWTAVVDDLQSAMVVTMVVAAVVLCLYLMGLSINDEDVKKTVVTALLAACIIPAIIVIFVPSSKTITKMVVAQNVTYERLEMASDTAQTVYEDIMELFGEDGDG